jgi:hypothetical protein
MLRPNDSYSGPRAPADWRSIAAVISAANDRAWRQSRKPSNPNTASASRLSTTKIMAQPKKLTVELDHAAHKIVGGVIGEVRAWRPVDQARKACSASAAR